MPTMTPGAMPAPTGFTNQFSLSNSAHPTLILVDLFLKGVPIIAYIFSFFYGGNLIIKLSIITLISAIDFWFTKNVLGRLLCGLKWGRTIYPDGSEKYFYEGRNEQFTNSIDRSCFWALQWGATAIWAVLFVLNILRITNLLVIVIPLALIAFNTISFMRCSRDHQNQLQGLVTQGRGQATNFIAGQFINTMTAN